MTEATLLVAMVKLLYVTIKCQFMNGSVYHKYQGNGWKAGSVVQPT